MQIKECKDLNLNKGLNLNLNYSRGVKSFCYFFSTGGWTYTYKALNAANNQLFQTANGARPGVSKVCYKKKNTKLQLFSHLMPKYGARLRISLGNNVNTSFFEYSHQNTGTKSRPCTSALNGTWVLGIPSV